MQSEALKPCPFCGCEKILDGYIRDGREIVCGECRASVAAFHPDASKRAAERWNRRADDALSDAELQVCRERRYAFALPDDELAKDARELLTELDGFNGMEYDSDSEVACQRAHSIISALLERFETPAPSVAVKALEWIDDVAEYDDLGLRYILEDGDGLDEEEANGWYALEETTNTVIMADGSPEGAMLAVQADFERRILSALSAQVQDVAKVSPVDYMRRHDAAIAAYEANTPNDYRYSALALRKAVDAAFAVAAAPAKQEG